MPAETKHSTAKASHLGHASNAARRLCPADRVPRQAIGHGQRGDEHVDGGAAVRHGIEYRAATGPERREAAVPARTPNGIL